MASIHKRPDGTWHLSFRINGTQFKPSLKTKSSRRAEQSRAVAEETIGLLETGRIALPEGARRSQVTQFILSGGKVTEKPTVSREASLSEVVEEYFKSYTTGKDELTVAGEHVHADHLSRVIGKGKSFSEITTDVLQEYAGERSKEDGQRGRTISGETIRKELRTFAQIWKMARIKGYVNGACPAKGVRTPLPDEKPAFKTWGEIERIIGRGGLTKDEELEYWDTLFLDEGQVVEFLDYIANKSEYTFVHAGLSFAAFTGARRSEVMRSLIEDWDFDRGVVRLREKKGSRKRNITFREVQVHARLHEVMVEWFAVHPGRVHTIVVPPGLRRNAKEPVPLTPNSAHYYFEAVTRDSKWKVLRGWHVLRHSFCSNCARRGIPENVIDAWMGHRGDEAVKKRYRHLFPSDTREFMGALFNGGVAASHDCESTRSRRDECANAQSAVLSGATPV